MASFIDCLFSSKGSGFFSNEPGVVKNAQRNTIQIQDHSTRMRESYQTSQVPRRRYGNNDNIRRAVVDNNQFLNLKINSGKYINNIESFNSLLDEAEKLPDEYYHELIKSFSNNKDIMIDNQKSGLLIEEVTQNIEDKEDIFVVFLNIIKANSHPDNIKYILENLNYLSKDRQLEIIRILMIKFDNNSESGQMLFQKLVEFINSNSNCFSLINEAKNIIRNKIVNLNLNNVKEMESLVEHMVSINHEGIQKEFLSFIAATTNTPKVASMAFSSATPGSSLAVLGKAITNESLYNKDFFESIFTILDHLSKNLKNFSEKDVNYIFSKMEKHPKFDTQEFLEIFFDPLTLKKQFNTQQDKLEFLSRWLNHSGKVSLKQVIESLRNREDRSLGDHALAPEENQPQEKKENSRQIKKTTTLLNERQSRFLHAVARNLATEEAFIHYAGFINKIRESSRVKYINSLLTNPYVGDKEKMDILISRVISRLEREKSVESVLKTMAGSVEDISHYKWVSVMLRKIPDREDTIGLKHEILKTLLNNTRVPVTAERNKISFNAGWW